MPIPMVEGHHHGPGGRLSCHPVSQHERWKGGRTIGLSGHLRESAHGFRKSAEAGAVAEWTTSPIATDMQHHKLRVPRVHGRVVESPSVQRTRPVANHNHIADIKKSVEQLLAFRHAKVERDT